MSDTVVRCKAEVQVSSMVYHTQRCSRKAWKDGYCKQHHPDTVEERRRKSMERYEAKRSLSPWRRLEEAKERIEQLEAERDALLADKGRLMQCVQSLHAILKERKYHLTTDDAWEIQQMVTAAIAKAMGGAE